MTLLPDRDAVLRGAAIERMFTSSARQRNGQIQRDFGVRPETALDGRQRGRHRALLARTRRSSAIRTRSCASGRASDPEQGRRDADRGAGAAAGDRRGSRWWTTTIPDNSALKRARRARLRRPRSTSSAGSRPTTLVHLYRRAAVVAVPSRYEGFGLPAAGGHGLRHPGGGTAAGALPEVVATGGGGVLVNRRTTRRPWPRGIARLLDQPEARAELGARGTRPRGSSNAYSWPRIAAPPPRSTPRSIATSRRKAPGLTDQRRHPAAQLRRAGSGGAFQPRRGAARSQAHTAERAPAARAGRRAAHRLQPGRPQAREQPSTLSSSTNGEACSRIRSSS